VLKQPDLDRVAKLLEAEGRALTPPRGALQRVLARAASQQRTHRPQSFVWLRPALAAMTVVALVIGLGGGAYASTPGDPLYSVQRALDDAYLTLPRTPEDAAHASIGVAERRVTQAANAQAKVSATVLRSTLSDAVRYFARARALVAAMPDGQRQQVSTALAASERAARDRLAEARDRPEGSNDNVLDEATSVLERESQRDANEGQPGPGTPERSPEPQPGQTQPGQTGNEQQSPGQPTPTQNAKDDVAPTVAPSNDPPTTDPGDKSTGP
jgi:hypothetical protein